METDSEKKLEEQVMDFIATETLFPRDKLRSDLTLFRDLGLDGDDASDLIEAFGKRFGVDLGAFEFSKHFGPELPAFPPLFLVQIFRMRVLGHDVHQIAHVEPITLGNLVEAARLKKWPLKFP
jgi:hypothetical protein